MVIVIEEELNGWISRYFRLQSKISSDVERRIELKIKYFSQSLYTHVEQDDLGEFKQFSFNIQREVCNYLDDLACLDRRIEDKKLKKRYFDDYLSGIPATAREYLDCRYLKRLPIAIDRGIEQNTLEEIYEIEDALKFMRGEEPDPLIRVDEIEDIGLYEDEEMDEETKTLIRDYVYNPDIPIKELAYLNRWYNDKKDISHLRGLKLARAQLLFKALNAMPEEDKRLLALKYDRPKIRKGNTSSLPTDQAVAEEADMAEQEFSEKRKAAQKQLKATMIQLRDETIASGIF